MRESLLALWWISQCGVTYRALAEQEFRLCLHFAGNCNSDNSPAAFWAGTTCENGSVDGARTSQMEVAVEMEERMLSGDANA
jgi:hypothetical protein